MASFGLVSLLFIWALSAQTWFMETVKRQRCEVYFTTFTLQLTSPRSYIISVHKGKGWTVWGFFGGGGLGNIFVHGIFSARGVQEFFAMIKLQDIFFLDWGILSLHDFF